MGDDKGWLKFLAATKPFCREKSTERREVTSGQKNRLLYVIICYIPVIRSDDSDAVFSRIVLSLGFPSVCCKPMILKLEDE